MHKMPEIIKQSQLLRRLVFDKNTVKSQGRVDKWWLNSEGNRVAGFSCNLEWFGEKRQYLSWEEIDTIGADAILVNIIRDLPAQKEPEVEEVAIGSEIWTDAGNKVGWLADYVFKIGTGEVVYLLYKYHGWLGRLKGLYMLSPEKISSAGNKRVIVADAAVEASELYGSGFGYNLARAIAYLEEDLHKTKEDIQSMRRETQGWAENFQGKAQQVKEPAQQTAGEIKEKAPTLATEAQQQGEKIKENVGEQHQELKQDSQSDGSGENPEETSNEFQNQIKEVTEKAKEMVGGIKSRQDTPSVVTLNEEEGETEGPRAEGLTAEGPKAEEGETEGPRAEGLTAEGPKAEEGESEGPKAETPKAVEGETEEGESEVPKAETRKAEEGESEGQKAEMPKAEEGESEGPKAEMPKAEEGESEGPKAEDGKTEGEKAEGEKAEEGETDLKKTDEAAPDNQPKES